MTKVRYFLLGAALAGAALAVPAAAQIAAALLNGSTICDGCGANSIVFTAPGGGNPPISSPATLSTVTGVGPAGFIAATSSVASQGSTGGL